MLGTSISTLSDSNVKIKIIIGLGKLITKTGKLIRLNIKIRGRLVRLCRHGDSLCKSDKLCRLGVRYYLEDEWTHGSVA